MCGRFSLCTALVSWLRSLFCAPAIASKVSQLDYSALQTKNDTHCNAERNSETHGPQWPLVHFPQEVQRWAFLCLSGCMLWEARELLS